MMSTKFSRRASIISRRWALGVGHGALLAALAAGGCAKARAQTVPNGPPLAMPQPPSRVFSPLEEEPLVSSPVAEAESATTPNKVASTPPAVRRTSTPPEPERPAPTPAPAAEVPRELRPASAPADPEAERRITEMIRNARADLNRVDYRALTRGGREQYESAKGFIDEAEKALVVRNFIYAQTAADKAAKLASELLGR